MASGNEKTYARANWIQAVDELVSGIRELISESGDLNLYTSEIRLADLRLMADRVRSAQRGLEVHNGTAEDQ